MNRLLTIVLLTTLLSACGTVAGFGNDISGVANWTKEKMTGTNSTEQGK